MATKQFLRKNPDEDLLKTLKYDPLSLPILPDSQKQINQPIQDPLQLNIIPKRLNLRNILIKHPSRNKLRKNFILQGIQVSKSIDLIIRIPISFFRPRLRKSIFLPKMRFIIDYDSWGFNDRFKKLRELTKRIKICPVMRILKRVPKDLVNNIPLSYHLLETTPSTWKRHDRIFKTLFKGLRTKILKIQEKNCLFQTNIVKDRLKHIKILNSQCFSLEGYSNIYTTLTKSSNNIRNLELTIQGNHNMEALFGQFEFGHLILLQKLNLNFYLRSLDEIPSIYPLIMALSQRNLNFNIDLKVYIYSNEKGSSIFIHNLLRHSPMITFLDELINNQPVKRDILVGLSYINLTSIQLNEISESHCHPEYQFIEFKVKSVYNSDIVFHLNLRNMSCQILKYLLETYDNRLTTSLFHCSFVGKKVFEYGRFLFNQVFTMEIDDEQTFNSLQAFLNIASYEKINIKVNNSVYLNQVIELIEININTIQSFLLDAPEDWDPFDYLINKYDSTKAKTFEICHKNLKLTYDYNRKMTIEAKISEEPLMAKLKGYLQFCEKKVYNLILSNSDGWNFLNYFDEFVLSIPLVDISNSYLNVESYQEKKIIITILENYNVNNLFDFIKFIPTSIEEILIIQSHSDELETLDKINWHVFPENFRKIEYENKNVHLKYSYEEKLVVMIKNEDAFSSEKLISYLKSIEGKVKGIIISIDSKVSIDWEFLLELLKSFTDGCNFPVEFKHEYLKILWKHSELSIQMNMVVFAEALLHNGRLLKILSYFPKFLIRSYYINKRRSEIDFSKISLEGGVFRSTINYTGSSNFSNISDINHKTQLTCLQNRVGIHNLEIGLIEESDCSQNYLALFSEIKQFKELRSLSVMAHFDKDLTKGLFEDLNNFIKEIDSSKLRFLNLNFVFKTNISSENLNTLIQTFRCLEKLENLSLKFNKATIAVWKMDQDEFIPRIERLNQSQIKLTTDFKNCNFINPK